MRGSPGYAAPHAAKSVFSISLYPEAQVIETFTPLPACASGYGLNDLVVLKPSDDAMRSTGMDKP